MTEIFQKATDGNIIGLDWTSLKNNVASEAAGRPIFDKVLMASIRSPGQKKSEVMYEAIREYSDGRVKKDAALYAKYGPEIQRFLDLGENSADLKGTPITEVPWIDGRLALELKSLGVHTLETMSDLSDAALQNIGPGARALKEKAKAYIAHATDSAAATRYATENLQLRTEIDDLRGQLSQLSQTIVMLQAAVGSKSENAAPAIPLAPVAPAAPAAPSMSAAMAKSLANFIPTDPPATVAGKKRGPKSKAEKAALAASTQAA